MNRARRHAKSRKPTLRWSQPRRTVLVRRKDITPEEYTALPIERKYPTRLLKAREEPYMCGTMWLRAKEFVGPPKPSIESRYMGYPLTNWKRKRLHNSESHRYFMRRILKDPRYR